MEAPSLLYRNDVIFFTVSCRIICRCSSGWFTFHSGAQPMPVFCDIHRYAACIPCCVWHTVAASYPYHPFCLNGFGNDVKQRKHVNAYYRVSCVMAAAPAAAIIVTSQSVFPTHDHDRICSTGTGESTLNFVVIDTWHNTVARQQQQKEKNVFSVCVAGGDGERFP